MIGSNKERREFIKDMVKYSSAALAAVGLNGCHRTVKVIASPNKQLQESLRINVSPVSPTLKLSPAALKTPLPEGWLRDIREFLTRTGKWKGHPVRSLEHYIISPAPGVIPEPSVIGPSTKPVFTSLGFGDIRVTDNTVDCVTNMCGTQHIPDLIPQCTTHFCAVLDVGLDFSPEGYFGCIVFGVGSSSWVPCNGSMYYGECNGEYSSECTTLVPDDCAFRCGNYCSSEVASAFNDFWDHPFVQELVAYFDVSSAETLQSAVTNYIGRNMYDATAL